MNHAQFVDIEWVRTEVSKLNVGSSGIQIDSTIQRLMDCAILDLMFKDDENKRNDVIIVQWSSTPYMFHVTTQSTMYDGARDGLCFFHENYTSKEATADRILELIVKNEKTKMRDGTAPLVM